MRKYIQFLRKSFSYRVIRVFFVLLILVYFLYSRIYHVGHDMLTKEMSQSLYTKASYLIEKLEQELDRIRRLENECLNEDTLYYNIGSFDIAGESEKVQRLLDMEQRLKILHESSYYIDEVFLYIPKLQRRISSVNGVEKIGQSEQKMYQLQKKSLESAFFYDEKKLYMGTSYPQNAGKNNSGFTYTLFVRISEEAIRKEFYSVNEANSGGICLEDQGENFSVSVGKKISLEEVKEQKQQWIGQIRNPDENLEYTVCRIYSALLNMNLFIYVSNEQVYENLEMYQNIFFVCMLMMILTMLVCIYYTHQVVSKPIKTLVQHMGKMEKGNLSVRITEKREDEFGYVYVALNQMAQSLQDQMEINYKQKLLMQQAELKHMQSQINPHFLYNSFFSIYRMAKDEDCESIVEFSSYLSEYYRYITKNVQREVELKAETEHAERYAMIQAMRFRRRLKVIYEKLPEKFESILVPKLILQPVLENAFEHGLKNVEEGGLLRVWYEEKEGKLLIHVTDNGSGMTEEEVGRLKERFTKNAGTVENGLCNINQRLKIKFGQNFGIEVDTEEGKGTDCVVILPGIQEE